MLLIPRGRRSASGQAAVETAITMPLTLFVVLGCLQLFMLMQAKVMAQYAIYQAARMGSVSNGRCDIMLHAAILSFSPAIRSLMSPSVGGSSAGDGLAKVFAEFKSNTYGTYGANGLAWGADTIVWIARESPRFPGTPLLLARDQWDFPMAPGSNTVRLELRAIFWAPMRIPFADWVFSRMELAHLGLQPYTSVNPLVPTQTANWQQNTIGPWTLENPIALEYQARLAAKHYVFPIQVTYTMRMMSPVQLADFAAPNCPGTPGSL